MSEELNDAHRFYVGIDDGAHFTIFETTNHIFEALCSYYEQINLGREVTWEWVELGQWINCEGEFTEMETLEAYEFKEVNND
jgi:hypothetical protein